MIRFINLTGQILIDDPEVHFAWYDTIKDKFIAFQDNRSWHTWEKFEQDLRLHYMWFHADENIDEVIARFKCLFPGPFQCSDCNTVMKFTKARSALYTCPNQSCDQFGTFFEK